MRRTANYRLISQPPGSLGRRHSPLLIPGVSQGGPEHLRGSVVDRLIDAERAGAHTVLLAGERADLGTDVAAICRYIVTDDAAVEQEAAGRFGPERVLRATSTDPADAAQWLSRLPRPEAQTLRRKVRNWARQIPLIRRLYETMAPAPGKGVR